MRSSLKMMLIGTFDFYLNCLPWPREFAHFRKYRYPSVNTPHMEMIGTYYGQAIAESSPRRTIFEHTLLVTIQQSRHSRTSHGLWE